MSLVRGTLHVDEIGYTLLTEGDTNGPIYMGLAIPGSATSDPAWQIRHLTYDTFGNPTIKYANGTAAHTAVWDNRASLSYS